MNSEDKLTTYSLDTSSTSAHFGQVVWANLGSSPFWPAVIFTEENQEWNRHKGKSSYAHVFFFGETAERSWIQKTLVLPFIGTVKFSQQRNGWLRKIKKKNTRRTKINIER
ncbi:unnamed protein product [Rotaria magnacalcarata]|uniref:PWWP domain-containing protein n=1 Tax=Rotaria magnacalcarata TaxID=392030 RepID=A0A819HY74_9BILA|nr:unnamed protein product [Rotaria magnacalcarata]CAF4080983.1 unnamed protein product [Rotaria magnacalcarata]